MARWARRGPAPVPDRRSQPRLPGVLRAAGVDRDLHRRADQRDLRVRLDAREDRHRVRGSSDRRRLGRGHLGAHRAVRRVQGHAPLAPGPAQAAVAGDGTAGRGVWLSQRQGGRLRGRRRDRLARRARSRGGLAGDDRHRRPRRVSADRRGRSRQGDGDLTRDHRDEDLRPPGRDRPLRHPARADPRLLRPEGRHLRQHSRRPRNRRQDRLRADPALRIARGRARAHSRYRRGQAQAEPDRSRRGCARVQAPGDRPARSRRRGRPGRGGA